jgi:hypothetical protein
MYIITTFSLVYLTEWIGHFGLWLVSIPVAIGFIAGIGHFEKLENHKTNLWGLLFSKRAKVSRHIAQISS